MNTFTKWLFGLSLDQVLRFALENPWHGGPPINTSTPLVNDGVTVYLWECGYEIAFIVLCDGGWCVCHWYAPFKNTIPLFCQRWTRHNLPNRRFSIRVSNWNAATHTNTHQRFWTYRPKAMYVVVFDVLSVVVSCVAPYASLPQHIIMPIQGRGKMYSLRFSRSTNAPIHRSNQANMGLIFICVCSL